MATFTSAVSDLERSGPVIDRTVAVPKPVEDALLASRQPVPPPIPVAMMVDTGASSSVIEPSIALQLGLHPIGVTPVATPTLERPVERAMYYVRLLLPPPGLVATVTAIGAELHGQNIHGLIGRDLLKFGVLVYIGTENQFTLSF